MVFRELTTAAQLRAISDFQQSWEIYDLHYDEATAHAILWDSEDEYTSKGEYIRDNTHTG